MVIVASIIVLVALVGWAFSIFFFFSPSVRHAFHTCAKNEVDFKNFEFEFANSPFYCDPSSTDGILLLLEYNTIQSIHSSPTRAQS